MLNSSRMLAQCSIFEKFANFPEHAFFLRNVQSSIYIPGMCGHAAHAGFHLYLGNVLVLLQNRMGCILSATQPNHISQSETIIKSSSPSSSYNHYHHTIKPSSWKNRNQLQSLRPFFLATNVYVSHFPAIKTLPCFDVYFWVKLKLGYLRVATKFNFPTTLL